MTWLAGTALVQAARTPETAAATTAATAAAATRPIYTQHSRYRRAV